MMREQEQRGHLLTSQQSHARALVRREDLYSPPKPESCAETTGADTFSTRCTTTSHTIIALHLVESYRNCDDAGTAEEKAAAATMELPGTAHSLTSTDHG